MAKNLKPNQLNHPFGWRSDGRGTSWHNAQHLVYRFDVLEQIGVEAPTNLESFPRRSRDDHAAQGNQCSILSADSYAMRLEF